MAMTHVYVPVYNITQLICLLHNTLYYITSTTMATTASTDNSITTEFLKQFIILFG